MATVVSDCCVKRGKLERSDERARTRTAEETGEAFLEERSEREEEIEREWRWCWLREQAGNAH